MALISVAEAHVRLMRLFSAVGTETVPLAQSCGRVLASDLIAGRPQPPFDASAMDGYAVRRQDVETGASLLLVGTSAAGAGFDGKVGQGQAVRIFTGAPVPEGADMILIQEDATLNGKTVSVGNNRDTADYIRPAGGDFSAGARMTSPRRLNARDIALAAAMNQPVLTVMRKPVVAILPTGDELVAPGDHPRGDQIVASNNYGLAAMLQAAGAEVRLLPIAGDTLESLDQVFSLTADADVVVTLGGASVGDHDLVQASAVRNGLDLEFYRVAMRPGKPLMAGRLGSIPFIGLPGNPVSSLVCGRIFLLPALDVMLGLEGKMPRRHPAVLDGDLAANGPREHYMRALVAEDGSGWKCVPYTRQDSSLLSVLADSNALLVRPPGDTGKKNGVSVEFIWL